MGPMLACNLGKINPDREEKCPTVNGVPKEPEPEGSYTGPTSCYMANPFPQETAKHAVLVTCSCKGSTDKSGITLKDCDEGCLKKQGIPDEVLEMTTMEG